MPQASYALALKKLSIRAYSTEEMRQLLIRAGYDSSVINETIEKLLTKGYLNDAHLAESLYACYTELKLCGPALLRNKLFQKGLPEDLVNSTLAGYDDEMEFQIAILLTDKFLRRFRHDPAALARFLVRKGFQRNTILKILNEHCLSGDI